MASVNRPATLLRLATGRDLDLSAPDPALIDWPSLGLALARLPRWTGQTPASRPTYSVAEHSLRCAWVAEHLRYPAAYILACLLHDAHEGYLGEITRPVRAHLGERSPTALQALLELEARLQAAVCDAVGLPRGIFAHELVQLVDDAWLVVEAEEFHGLLLDPPPPLGLTTWHGALRAARECVGRVGAVDGAPAAWTRLGPVALAGVWTQELERLRDEG